MIYFDTDVLVHYIVNQDAEKNKLATRLFHETMQKGLFFCSLLSLQETAYVLSRLKINPQNIKEIIDTLLALFPAEYSIGEFNRAIELADKIGFNNINDCIHTDIAEKHCQELYTFNKQDFARLQKHTSLPVNIF